MVGDLMESYLDNIAEQVVDEDKIVTYKSLSRSLGIHVNTAKQLLHTYLANEKAKNSFPISATYLVAGKVIDGSFNVTIVNEDDLKNAYSTFVEITSEHVYSVQKGKNLKELKVLCGVNKDSSNSENPKLVITCSKSVLKSRGTVKKKVQNYEESNKKAIIQALVPEKQAASAPATNVKKVEIPTIKESTSKSPKKTSPKGNQQKGLGNAQKPAGNIANLFAKAAQKNATKPAAPAGKSEEKIQPKEVEVVQVAETEAKKPERRKLEGKSESGEKRKKKGNKRKRIQMLSDSEESDSNDAEEEKVEIEEDEDTIPCSLNIEEEEEKEVIPRNKRKKRKVIDKTVMHEDGYLETKKEVVFETDSENEPEDVTPALKQTEKPKIEPMSKGGQSAGTGKKQASLLTFFKKS